MRHSFIWFGLILVGTTIGTSSGQQDADRFGLDSKAVGVRYEIEVVVPRGTPPPGTEYPVVYCMDWFILADYFKALPKLMELGNLTEPYILVGITQGQSTRDWAVMRTRDFTPAYPTDEYSESNMYPEALELTGGAANFAVFLKEELIPNIESRYQGDPSRRGFVGYSLGGLLGAHLLTHNPELFQYYLLGSPSLWFNDYYLASDLERMPPDSLRTIRKVYLSVGGEESWEMLKGFGILRSVLREKGFEDPRIRTEIIDANGHVGAMPIALYKGIRFLFPSD